MKFWSFLIQTAVKRPKFSILHSFRDNTAETNALIVLRWGTFTFYYIIYIRHKLKMFSCTYIILWKDSTICKSFMFVMLYTRLLFQEFFTLPWLLIIHPNQYQPIIVINSDLGLWGIAKPHSDIWYQPLHTIICFVPTGSITQCSFMIKASFVQNRATNYVLFTALVWINEDMEVFCI